MMSSKTINWIITIYTAGVIIHFLRSLQFLFQKNEIKKHIDIDLLEKRPDVKIYLLLFKPIFWPLLFITEKNPIERISELFFKHYGEPGHTYLRDQGLKNFLNDLMKGKNRYKCYEIKKLLWPVDKNGEEYKEMKKYFNNDNKLVYASIIYAHHKEKFLLGVTWGSKETLGDERPVSRFQLDQCELMSFLEFKKRLLSINYSKACEILECS